MTTTPTNTSVHESAHPRKRAHVDSGSRSPSTKTPSTTDVIICATFPHVHTTTLLPSLRPFVWHINPRAVNAPDAAKGRSIQSDVGVEFKGVSWRSKASTSGIESEVWAERDAGKSP